MHNLITVKTQNDLIVTYFLLLFTSYALTTSQVVCMQL